MSQALKTRRSDEVSGRVIYLEAKILAGAVISVLVIIVAQVYQLVVIHDAELCDAERTVERSSSVEYE